MIRLNAPAKVNWFLEITGRRPDGYHTLSTIFQTISLSDEITMRLDTRLSLTCSDASLPTDERNLAFRAATRLQALLHEKRGARIHLRKRIPMGAGLGGGSSDAAAVLIGLQRLWKKRAPGSALLRCAAALGADVPFFLKKGMCSAGGIGERLRPLKPLRAQWMVLVYPGFGVSTKDAYARVRLPWARRRSSRPLLTAFNKEAPAALWGRHLFNRFEELVFPLNPSLADLKSALRDHGSPGVLMSGSGSSIFALAKSAAHARTMRRQIANTYPQSWVVRTIS